MVLSRAPCTSSIRRRPARYRTDERINDWLIEQNLTEKQQMSAGLVRISYQTSAQEQRCVLCNSYLHLTHEIWGKATFWKGGIFFIIVLQHLILCALLPLHSRDYNCSFNWLSQLIFAPECLSETALSSQTCLRRCIPVSGSQAKLLNKQEDVLTSAPLSPILRHLLGVKLTSQRLPGSCYFGLVELDSW